MSTYQTQSKDIECINVLCLMLTTVFSTCMYACFRHGDPTCSNHNSIDLRVAIVTCLNDLSAIEEGVSLMLLGIVGGVVNWNGCLGNRHTLS